MFDLTVFANPARLKRDFLATTEVADQEIPPELNREFEQLREENPSLCNPPSGRSRTVSELVYEHVMVHSEPS